MSKNLKPYDLLVISFRYVTLADHDGLISMIRFIEEQEKVNIRVVLTGVKKNMHRKITKIQGLKREFYLRSWHTMLQNMDKSGKL